LRGGTSERVDVVMSKAECFNVILPNTLLYGKSETLQRVFAKAIAHAAVWICAVAMAGCALDKFRDATDGGNEAVFRVVKTFLGLTVATPGLAILQLVFTLPVFDCCGRKFLHCYATAVPAFFTSVGSVAFGATFAAHTLSMSGNVDQLQRYAYAGLMLCCLGTGLIIKYGVVELEEEEFTSARVSTSGP